MTFSKEWLKLREPADHRARNKELFNKVKAHLSPLPSLNIMDIGCGSGSNLRAMALELPQKLQNWVLVDYDAALLEAAKEELKTFAASHVETREGLTLKREGKEIYVRFIQADLTQELEQLLSLEPDLLTSAAFFDLCSQDFITKLAKGCSTHKIPLYTVLTYDGEESWEPSHALDKRRLEAFLKHQNGDKGFGAALGAKANAGLLKAFEAQNYTCHSAKSPWVIEQDEAPFLEALASGAAQACVETGDFTLQEAESWLTHHKKAKRVSVGHDDFFAFISA